MALYPLVSLICVVKNGMPYLPEAIKSVQNQTYRNFELIIQDGKSTDGTVDFIKSLKGIKNIQVHSQLDKNLAQGWNRVLAKCSGEIIGSIDADNLLKKESLEAIVKLFKKYPQSAAIYGTSKLIDGSSKKIQKNKGRLQAQPFNLIRLMRCELVPSFASSYFSRKICGKELYLDERMETCWDFDLWLRLSRLSIYATHHLFSYTRRHSGSSTCQSENYERFCKNKIYALQKYFSHVNQNAVNQELYNYSVAGIYTWVAESIYGLEGGSKRFDKFCKQALALDPYLQRIKELKIYSQNNFPL